MKVIVLGGTGMVGSKLMQKLLENQTIESVTMVTRRPVDNLSHPKLKQLLVDFDSLTKESEKEIQGHDVLFNCMGTTRAAAGSGEAFYRIDHDYPLKICKLHDGHGLISVSSTGANPNSLFLYPKTKGKLEQALIDLKRPNLAIFRPGLLMLEGEKRPTNRFFEALAISFANTLGIKNGTVKCSTVANSMLQTALAFDPKSTSFKIYENPDIQKFEA